MDAVMNFSTNSKARKIVTNLHQISFIIWSRGVMIAKPRKFDTANIKGFTVCHI